MNALKGNIPAAFMAVGVALITGQGPAAQAGEWIAPAAPEEEGVKWSLGYAGMWNKWDVDGDYYSGPFDDYDYENGNGAEGAGLAPPPGRDVKKKKAKWHENYDDTDGWLNGVTGELIFPSLWGASIDFRYLTGDLDGDVKISPIGSPMTFKADADIDRDVFELGLSVPVPQWNWLYGRVEYFYFDDDVTWDYGGGEREKQEYDTKGVRFGLGVARQIPLGSSPVTLIVHGFGGGVYFDYTHREKSIGVSDDDDGWGYFVRGGAQLAVPVGSGFSIVGGASYEYMDLSGDDVDIENQGFSVNLGFAGSF